MEKPTNLCLSQGDVLESDNGELSNSKPIEFWKHQYEGTPAPQISFLHHDLERKNRELERKLGELTQEQARRDEKFARLQTTYYEEVARRRSCEIALKRAKKLVQEYLGNLSSQIYDLEVKNAEITTSEGILNTKYRSLKENNAHLRKELDLLNRTVEMHSNTIRKQEKQLNLGKSVSDFQLRHLQIEIDRLNAEADKRQDQLLND